MNLSCHGLSFSYGPRPVLQGIDLAIGASDFLALVGPNGAGKTTLLRLLCGELVPAEGAVSLDGEPPHRLHPQDRAQRLAVVAQQTPMPFGFTVEEVVMWGRAPYLGPFAFPGEEDREHLEAALLATELQELRHRPLNELSGGEQQRVALARALAQQTPGLILDEPTRGLDLRYQVATMRLLKGLLGEGRSIVCVSHDLNLVAPHCNLMGVLHEGRLAALGPPAEVLRAELLSEVYRVPVVVERGQAGVPFVRY